MFQQLPVQISQGYPPRYIPSSPTSSSFPLFQSQSRVIQTISPVSRLPSLPLRTIKAQNDKSLDLVSEQLKLVSSLSETNDAEGFKQKMPLLLSNLQGTLDNLLKSNKILQDLEPCEGKVEPKGEEQRDPDLEKKYETILEQNNFLSKECELKEKKIQNLKQLLVERETESEDWNDTAKTQDEKKTELESSKNRCKVLMDINAELRESLEILLHENNKLNRMLSGEFKKLKEDEEWKGLIYFWFLIN